MVGVTIAETDKQIVITLDKSTVSKLTLERVLHDLEEQVIDISHLEFVSDEEQEEIRSLLNAMTDEDKKIVYTHHAKG